MTNIIFIRTFEEPRFEEAINQALEFSVNNTEKFLFGRGDSTIMGTRTVYNAVRAHADSSTTGIVIYHNADGVLNNMAFSQFVTALKSITAMANVKINLVYQVNHKSGNPPTLREYNF